MIYTPYDDLKSLYLWLDSSDLFDGVKSARAITGTWFDKSPNKFVFVNDDTNTAPAGGDFAGGDSLSLLSGSAIAAAGNASYGGINNFPSEFHIFIVGQTRTNANSHGRFFHASSPSGDSFDFSFVDFTKTDTPNSGDGVMSNAFEFNYSGNPSSVGTTTIAQSNNSQYQGSKALFEVYKDSTEIGTSVNGQSYETTSQSFTLSNSYTITLNQDYDGNAGEARIEQFLIFNRRLSVLESQKVQSYLVNKIFGSGLLLPNSNPYKFSQAVSESRFNNSNLISPREPVLFCELHLDHCFNKYGSTSGFSNCTAAGDDSDACFNTISTCQDKNNYSLQRKKFVFCQELGVGLEGRVSDAPQCLISAKQAPVEIMPTKGVSVRANVTIKLRDFVSNDKGIDPYFSSRNYIASNKGTYFSKLIARNPFYTGRTVKIYYGYLDSDGFIQSYDGRKEYIIESMSLDKDVCTIKAKDPLSLTDALKSEAPVSYSHVLMADLSHGVNHHVKIETATGNQITGSALNSRFGSNNTYGYMRINEEIIKYRVSTSSSTITDHHLELLSGFRGNWGTLEADHEAGDSVQACLSFGDYQDSATGVSLRDAAHKLLTLTDYAGIDTSVINNTAGGNNSWVDENTQWLSSYNINAIISEPEQVSSILSRFAKQLGVNFYYDDTYNQIIMRTETPQLNANLIPEVTDQHIVRDSFKFIDSAKQRISRVFYYYNMVNHVEDRDDAKNYKNLQVSVDSDAETSNEYDQKAIKTIYADGVIESATASSMSQRMLSRYRSPPKSVVFSLDASFQTINDDGSLALMTTGCHFNLTTKDIVDSFGEPISLRMQCTSLQFDYIKQIYTVKALQIGSANYNPCVLADANNALSSDSVFAEKFYAEFTIVDGGAGYSLNDSLSLTGGNGTGFTVTVTAVNSGAATALSVTEYGTGYVTSDVIGDSGGLSIRLTSVSAKTSIASAPVADPFLII